MNVSIIAGEFDSEEISENRRSGLDFRFAARAQTDDANVGQIAVALVVVKAVADHELIGDDEAGIVGLDVGRFGAPPCRAKTATRRCLGFAFFE